MRTEYSAQVSAAQSRLILPKKYPGEIWAERGSRTMITPTVARIKLNKRFRVIRSPSIQNANYTTKTGVAEVTKAPLDAVDNFVPTNWKPSEMP